MSLHVGNLHRSISAIGFGFQQETIRKTAETSRSKLQEVEQQFQIEVQGDADSRLVWTEQELNFHEILYYAPAQRASNRLETPHVYFGSVMKSGNPTALHGVVKRWKQSATGAFVGAFIGIAAQGNGKFAAYLHVTVQGYGAPLDHDNAQSETG
ncbi:MAG: hypothetical protein NVS3B1_07740 [Marmoricola sp.]